MENKNNETVVILLITYSALCFFFLNLIQPREFMPCAYGIQYAEMVGEPFNILRSDMRVRPLGPIIAGILGFDPYGWNYFLYSSLIFGSLFFSFYFLKENLALALLIPSLTVTSSLSGHMLLWPGYPDIICLLFLAFALILRSNFYALIALSASILSHEEGLLFVPFVLLYRKCYLGTFQFRSRHFFVFAGVIFLYLAARIALSFRGEYYSLGPYFWNFFHVSPAGTSHAPHNSLKCLFSLPYVFGQWGLWLISLVVGIISLRKESTARIMVWVFFGAAFFMLFAVASDCERRFPFLVIPVIGAFRIMFSRPRIPWVGLVIVLTLLHLIIPGHPTVRAFQASLMKMRDTVSEIKENGVPLRRQYFPFRRVHLYSDKEMPFRTEETGQPKRAGETSPNQSLKQADK